MMAVGGHSLLVTQAGQRLMHSSGYIFTLRNWITGNRSQRGNPRKISNQGHKPSNFSVDKFFNQRKKIKPA